MDQRTVHPPTPPEGPPSAPKTGRGKRAPAAGRFRFPRGDPSSARGVAGAPRAERTHESRAAQPRAVPRARAAGRRSRIREPTSETNTRPRRAARSSPNASIAHLRRTVWIVSKEQKLQRSTRRRRAPPQWPVQIRRHPAREGGGKGGRGAACARHALQLGRARRRVGRALTRPGPPRGAARSGPAPLCGESRTRCGLSGVLLARGRGRGAAIRPRAAANSPRGRHAPAARSRAPRALAGTSGEGGASTGGREGGLKGVSEAGSERRNGSSRTKASERERSGKRGGRGRGEGEREGVEGRKGRGGMGKKGRGGMGEGRAVVEGRRVRGREGKGERRGRACAEEPSGSRRRVVSGFAGAGAVGWPVAVAVRPRRWRRSSRRASSGPSARGYSSTLRGSWRGRWRGPRSARARAGPRARVRRCRAAPCP